MERHINLYLNFRRLYCYDNGRLITKTNDTMRLLKIPQVIWTFKNVPSDLYPAVYCEGDVKFSLFCNQINPTLPGELRLFSTSLNLSVDILGQCLN